MSLGWLLILYGAAVAVPMVRLTIKNRRQGQTGEISYEESLRRHLGIGLILFPSIWTIILGIVVLIWYGGK